MGLIDNNMTLCFFYHYVNNKIQFFFACISRICRQVCNTRSRKYGVRLLVKMAFLTIFAQRPYPELPRGLQQHKISCPSMVNLLPCMDCPDVFLIWCGILSNTTDGILHRNKPHMLVHNWGGSSNC
jgi:hypothetical protein